MLRHMVTATRRVVPVVVQVAAVMLASAVVLSGTGGAHAEAARRQTGGMHFLTLPFTDPRIVVQQGWIYSWGDEHKGIDYVLGGRDTGNWQSFDVVAAADGWACGNCTTRQGNAVWIKHNINGATYYTYYGHLASIEPGIPTGSQQNVVWVRRGQKIGVAGDTGADSIHLHFQVSYGQVPVDPYDLWTTREPYAPGCTSCQMGDNYLWTTNPPGLPSGGVTTQSCTLNFEQTVSGTITDAAPEVRYCVTASAGDWLAASMFAVDGAPLDTYLKLYGPDGALLATDDDGAQVGTNSFLVYRLPADGTYELVATRFAGQGAYRLRLEKGSKSALGDLNRDCVVNSADLQLMSGLLGSADPSADLNLDGRVDEADRQIQFLRLGRGCMKLGN